MAKFHPLFCSLASSDNSLIPDLCYFPPFRSPLAVNKLIMFCVQFFPKCINIPVCNFSLKGLNCKCKKTYHPAVILQASEEVLQSRLGDTNSKVIRTLLLKQLHWFPVKPNFI